MAIKKPIDLLTHLETDRETAAGITTVTYRGATMAEAAHVVSTLPGPVYMVAALNADLSEWVKVNKWSVHNVLTRQGDGDPCPMWVTNSKNDPDTWDIYIG